MYEDILVPTDGDESTDKLLTHVRDAARRRGATVHALYVVDDRSFFALDDDVQSNVRSELRDEGERSTAALADGLPSDVEVTQAIRRGDPATEILDYAGATDAGLVILGTRGDAHGENLLGSTAQSVAAESRVPVLSVPLDE